MKACRDRSFRGWLAIGMAVFALAAGCGQPGSKHGANWVMPGEGVAWERTRLRAQFVFPRSANPDSLRVVLNGKDHSAAFLPINQTRLSGADPLEAGGSSSDAGERGRTVHRAIAEFDARDLQRGENVLRAQFSDAQGDPVAVERRFRFEPQGREVRCRVLRIDERGTDRKAGSRIVVVPLEGAPAVDLASWSSSSIRPRAGPPVRQFAFVRAGEATFYLPEGRYRLIATGGPLDGIDEWITPERGAAEHEFVVRREVAIADTTTVDFHVHASPSRDSVVPLSERLFGFVASGVDVMVASDHDHITDYGPWIARLDGVRGRVGSIPGVETGLLFRGSKDAGHWNVWPLHPDPEAPPARGAQVSGRGALPSTNRSAPVRPSELCGEAAAMFDAYRAQARHLAKRAGLEGPEVDPALIALNHPRGLHFDPQTDSIEKARDFLSRVGFNPEVSLDGQVKGASKCSLDAASSSGTTALDFDTLEVWNRNSALLYQIVRRDWFSLLNQGYAHTGLANTDTHTLSPELSGYPMNIVFLPPGAPSGLRVSHAELARAVRAGRVVGTDGPVPLLTVRAQGRLAGPGDRLEATGGAVQIEVDVRAASWVPVGSIRIWANGRILCTQRVPEDGPLARPRSLACGASLERDTWITAEVGDPEAHSDGRPLEGVYGLIAPMGIALGFTNPVFIDVDGNGRFDAPGLVHGALPPKVPMRSRSAGASQSR